MKLEFTAYGQPKPAGSKTAFAFKRKNGTLGATVVDACKTTKPWQAIVSNAALDALQKISADDGFKIFDSALSMSIRFYVPRPKCHINAKGEVKKSAPAFVTTRPDALKLARAVEDACSKIVYRDDSQIVQESLSKNYGEPARVEVEIKTLE